MFANTAKFFEFNVTENSNLSIEDFVDLVGRNFTHSVISMGELHMHQTSRMHGPQVGIYANLINVTGEVSASGAGCKSDHGPGKGSQANDDCAGGGAAHAGNGGFGTNRSDTHDNPRACRTSDVARSYGGHDTETVSVGSGGGSRAT